MNRPQGLVQNDLTISANSYYYQSYNHLDLLCTIVCNRITNIIYAMNDIDATDQAFIDMLFAQMYGFRFIHLLQPRSFTVIDGRIVTLDLITHFVIT